MRCTQAYSFPPLLVRRANILLWIWWSSWSKTPRRGPRAWICYLHNPRCSPLLQIWPCMDSLPCVCHTSIPLSVNPRCTRTSSSPPTGTLVALGFGVQSSGTLGELVFVASRLGTSHDVRFVVLPAWNPWASMSRQWPQVLSLCIHSFPSKTQFLQPNEASALFGSCEIRLAKPVTSSVSKRMVPDSTTSNIK